MDFPFCWSKKPPEAYGLWFVIDCQKRFSSPSESAHFAVFNKVTGDVLNDHCGLAFLI